MPFLGRALYNLLRTKAKQGDFKNVQKWQIVDYRSLSIEELLNGLSALGLEIDVDRFERSAKEVDSPEELAATLAPHGEAREKIYLYLFELWRRLIDERETISIFCDELDLLIAHYEDDPAANDDTVYGMLKELIDILEQNVVNGQKPKPLFSIVSDYLSCDLESFIYNYIQDLIEQGRLLVASEIASNFVPYVEETLWYDLLKIKLLSGVSSEDTTAMMSRFLENLKEEPEFDLYVELLHYLNKTGHCELFEKVFKEMIPLIDTREEYIDALDLLFEFAHLNDRKEEEKIIEQLSNQMQSLEGRITKKDKQKLVALVK